jgi:mannonate dehydratase
MYSSCNARERSRIILPEWWKKARRIAENLSPAEAEELAYNIIVVTQGFIRGATDVSGTEYRKNFLDHVAAYRKIDSDGLRKNLSDFLKEMVPVAEENGVRLCIHPDDPPFPVLGLPRIASTLDDLQWICDQNVSISNGITFCTGSLSVRPGNDVEEMTSETGSSGSSLLICGTAC